MQQLATENSPIIVRNSGSIWSSILILCICIQNKVPLTTKASSSPAVKTKPKKSQANNLQTTRIFKFSAITVLFWLQLKASNSSNQQNKQKHQICISLVKSSISATFQKNCPCYCTFSENINSQC